MYGPPGLADNIEGLIRGVHWDRIGDQGPCFEVSELHDDRLIRFRLQAGRGHGDCLGEEAAMNGKMLDEPGFVVRAVTLDHGTPVLAYAFEPAVTISIRKESLAARGWQSGPWLGEFKRQLLAADRSTVIVLPDGTTGRADRLAEEFTRERTGRKLVYATDLADTPDNRSRLMQLARGCHTFFCEAAFAAADAHHAQRTGHLTTRACGEIARAADVRQLVPFHFSRRYDGQIGRLYSEIAAICTRVVIPKPLQEREYETD